MGGRPGIMQQRDHFHKSNKTSNCSNRDNFVRMTESSLEFIRFVSQRPVYGKEKIPNAIGFYLFIIKIRNSHNLPKKHSRKIGIFHFITNSNGITQSCAPQEEYPDVFPFVIFTLLKKQRVLNSYTHGWTTIPMFIYMIQC